MMNYTVAIGVLLSLNDSEKQFDDDAVLDAVEKILSMETINATPKDALLNALRWFWNKTVDVLQDPPQENPDEA